MNAAAHRQLRERLARELPAERLITDPLRRLASVSVVHDACRHADAMATALFVMGPERGLALAREQRLAALFIVREAGGGFRDLASPAFAALG